MTKSSVTLQTRSEDGVSEKSGAVGGWGGVQEWGKGTKWKRGRIREIDEVRR